MWPPKIMRIKMLDDVGCINVGEGIIRKPRQINGIADMVHIGRRIRVQNLPAFRPDFSADMQSSRHHEPPPSETFSRHHMPYGKYTRLGCTAMALPFTSYTAALVREKLTEPLRPRGCTRYSWRNRGSMPC